MYRSCGISFRLHEASGSAEVRRFIDVSEGRVVPVGRVELHSTDRKGCKV
jgi:hypothetical protein